MPTAERTTPAPRALVWLAILILYVVWGSTYLGIRIAIESIPPFLMAATRFAARRADHDRRGRDRPPRRARPALAVELRDSFIVGALLMGGGMGVGRLGRADRAVGHRRAPDRDDAGLDRDLRPGLPPTSACRSRRRSASASASLGVAILVGPSIVFEGSLDPAGIVALLLSPIFWAGGSLFAAHGAKLPRDPFVTTGAPDAERRDRPGRRRRRDRRARHASTRRRSPASRSIAMAYLTLVGSLVAFTAYAWVLRHAPLPLIATYAFVNPVVAVFLGALVLDESVTPLQIVAGAVIVVGVALIILSRSRMAGRRATASALRPRLPTTRRRSSRPRPDARPQASARTVRATRRASVMIVIIGLTPIPVGNSEPSAT